MVVSELLETLGFTVLSSSLTNCSDCDAAVASFVSDGDEEVLRSFCKVAKADCAVERSPEVSALPSAVRSVES